MDLPGAIWGFPVSQGLKKRFSVDTLKCHYLLKNSRCVHPEFLFSLRVTLVFSLNKKVIQPKEESIVEPMGVKTGDFHEQDNFWVLCLLLMVFGTSRFVQSLPCIFFELYN